MCCLLETAGISLKGVFLNADAGFDVEALRQVCAVKEIEGNIDDNRRRRSSRSETLPEAYRCFDEELYEERLGIERRSAWLDGFKGLLMRLEKKMESWITQHFMAFSVIVILNSTLVKIINSLSF